MSRSGYTDDIDNEWAFIRWRGAVASATRGKRGQALLRELLEALDAMPEKRLIANSFAAEGGYCTLGVIGAKRGAEMPVIDEDDFGFDPLEVREEAAAALDIAPAMAAEIIYWNDEGGWNETPEERWVRMRNWVAEQITEVA